MKLGRDLQASGIFLGFGNSAQLIRHSVVSCVAVAFLSSVTACGSKKSDTPAPKPAASSQPSTSPAPAADTEKQKQTGAADSSKGLQQSGQAAGSTAMSGQAGQGNNVSVVKVDSNQPVQSAITAGNNSQANALNGLLAGAGISLLTQSLLKDNPQLATALTTCLFTLGLGLIDSNSILASLQKVTGSTTATGGTTQNTQSAALTGCLTNLVKK
jgi:hypothetical protein